MIDTTHTDPTPIVGAALDPPPTPPRRTLTPDEAIRLAVAGAPPLTDEQLTRLRAIFASVGAAS